MVHANIPDVTLVHETIFVMLEIGHLSKDAFLFHPKIYQEKSANHQKKMVISEVAEVAAYKPRLR